MKTQNVCFRTDPELLEDSRILFGDLGITLSTAINVFLRTAVACGGFPFEPRTDLKIERVRQKIPDQKEHVRAPSEAEIKAYLRKLLSES